MKRRYISIGPDIDRTPDDERYEFELSTRFISNFLSRTIRKAKFTTDGTFDQIHVALVADKPGRPQIAGLNALQVHVIYERNVHGAIKGTKDCDYYLALFAKGFRKAATFKQVPLETLLSLLEEFHRGVRVDASTGQIMRTTQHHNSGSPEVVH